MIDITKLIESDKGRGVVYTDGVGNLEQGVITSWNDMYIFVNYGSHCMGRGIATRPEDLNFMSGK